jgi:hypothetical protein
VPSPQQAATSAAPQQGAATTRAEQLAAIARQYPALAARLAAHDAALAAGPLRHRSACHSECRPLNPLDDPATDPCRWQGFL